MESKPIELFYNTLHNKTFVVARFLTFLNIPFKSKIYDPQKPEEWNKDKTELLKTFPLTNLPYMKDSNNDKLIAETQAMMFYLAQKYKPEAGPSYEEVPDFMAMNGAVHDVSTGFMMEMCKATTINEIIEKISDSRKKFLGKLEMWEKLLEKEDWLFGNRFTFIDVNLAFFTEMALEMEIGVGAEYYSENQRKLLKAHMERVYQTEGVKK
jgi:glutathione S-transferase